MKAIQRSIISDTKVLNDRRNPACSEHDWTVSHQYRINEIN